MGDDVISKRNRKSVEAAVEHFVGNRHLFENFAQALMAYFRNDAGLARCTQFLKYRVKDPGHLREKLIRKAAQGDVIDETTLFDRITDLAGIRIIHLHTDQVARHSFGNPGHPCRATTSPCGRADRELLGYRVREPIQGIWNRDSVQGDDVHDDTLRDSGEPTYQSHVRGSSSDLDGRSVG